MPNTKGFSHLRKLNDEKREHNRADDGKGKQKVRRHPEDAVSQGTYVQCYYKLNEGHEEEHSGSSSFDVWRVEDNIEKDGPKDEKRDPDEDEYIPRKDALGWVPRRQFHYVRFD